MISYIIGSTIGFVGAGIARPPLCAPILFFLFLRKKRIAAPGEEKEREALQNRKCPRIPKL